MNKDDKFYIGNASFSFEKEKEKLQQRIKNLLLLNNVNFLFGNGASIPLGAPGISNTKECVITIDKNTNSDVPELNAVWKKIKNIANFNEGIAVLKKITSSDGFKLDIESFLNALIQSHNISSIKSFESDTISIGGNKFEKAHIETAIIILKAYLFYSCKSILDKIQGTTNKLRAHKEFLRRSLLRPVTLPRAKIFTINYDLIFERCMDELGVSYFDGFVGGYQKRLRPESYHYDLYYPGETTEGKVNRVDRVLQLYKLHGSINWTRVEESAENIFGIKQEFPEANKIGELMIYPSTLKYGETLGFPYTEMFQNFSFSLFKPQTVLFTFGYGFRDDHINRLIYQALSIPTFNLVIIVPEGDDNTEVKRLIESVGIKRILVIQGGRKCDKCNQLKGIGTFCGFVKDVMPDMEEMKTQEKINEEIQRLFSKTTNPLSETPEAEEVSQLENNWCCDYKEL